MGRPIALLGHQHTCPIHGGGPVMNPGQTLVRFNGIPLAGRAGNAAVPDLRRCPIRWSRGSGVVKINGRGVMLGWRQDGAWRQDRDGRSDPEIRLIWPRPER